MLLVQTSDVLVHPWTLLSLYCAAVSNVPVACVRVEGGGYDFAREREHLHRLSDRLGAADLAQLASVLVVAGVPRQSMPIIAEVQ